MDQILSNAPEYTVPSAPEHPVAPVPGRPRQASYSFDVVIIGAGPAGSTLARLLSSSFRVLLLDSPQEAPGIGGKLCGGLLAPDAQRMLAHFSLSLPRDILVDPQIFSVHTVDIGTGQTRDYPRAYVNVDRQKFDRWLVSLIPSRVTVLPARAVAIRRTGSGWCVTVRRESASTSADAAADQENLPSGAKAVSRPGPDPTNGAKEEYFTRCIVGAEGANSLVRRTLAPHTPIRTYLAIQEEFPATGSTAPQYACVFDRATSDCYSWLLCKNGTVLRGGAFSPAGCRKAFREQTAQTEAILGAFPPPHRTRACLVRRPRSLREIVPGGDNAFLIGEAAGWISPSSLEGISWAMQSAEILADTLNRYATGEGAAVGQEASSSDAKAAPVSDNRRESILFPPYLGKKFRRALRPMYRRLFLKLCKCPAMYHPLFRRLVMASGIGSITLRK